MESTRPPLQPAFDPFGERIEPVRSDLLRRGDRLSRRLAMTVFWLLAAGILIGRAYLDVPLGSPAYLLAEAKTRIVTALR